MDTSAAHPDLSQSIHSFSFPRTARLKRRKSIQQLFSGRSVPSRSVTFGSIRILFSVEQAEPIHSRRPVLTGFAVGRSAGGATTRNRVKRILREEYRHQQHAINSLFAGTSSVLNQMIVFRGEPRQENRIRMDLGRAIRALCEQVPRELSIDME